MAIHTLISKYTLAQARGDGSGWLSTHTGCWQPCCCRLPELEHAIPQM